MNLDKYKKNKGFKWFKYQWEFARRSDEYRFIYKNKVDLPSEIKQMLQLKVPRVANLVKIEILKVA